jgi:2-C-methyl-D-erythritol 2,4-cyclodiphosphate synthase
VPVVVVPASSANLKVTHPEDIAVAEALLLARHGEARVGANSGQGVILSASEESRFSARAHPTTTRSLVPRDDTVRDAMIRDDTATNSEPRVVAQMRTGIGYDAHRFGPERRLVLGGVEIWHDQGLVGHSDADVLLHAIADAVFGAAALGDIGQHFPPSDERFRDADSQDLLRHVVRLAEEAGWAPGNVDATLLAEAPRIGPHVPLMRERIAACLGISREAVGVKATTNEGMGVIGRGEGIAAMAIATLVPVRPNLER